MYADSIDDAPYDIKGSVMPTTGRSARHIPMFSAVCAMNIPAIPMQRKDAYFFLVFRAIQRIRSIRTVMRVRYSIVPRKPNFSASAEKQKSDCIA